MVFFQSSRVFSPGVCRCSTAAVMTGALLLKSAAARRDGTPDGTSAPREGGAAGRAGAVPAGRPARAGRQGASLRGRHLAARRRSEWAERRPSGPFLPVDGPPTVVAAGGRRAAAASADGPVHGG